MADKPPLSFSFSAGGWLGGSYHMGVVKALREKLVLDGVKTYGCSAGAWACMAMLLDPDVNIDDVHNDYCRCLQDLPAVPLLAEGVLRKMMQCMSETYAHNITTRFKTGEVLDSVFISVSKIPWPSVVPVNAIKESFASWTQVEDAVVESSMIPFIIGCRLNVLDGWLTGNILKEDEHTVVVNFVGLGGDIAPSEYFNPAYIIVRPPPDASAHAFDLGYRDALRYLGKVDRIGCRRLPETVEAC